MRHGKPIAPLTHHHPPGELADHVKDHPMATPTPKAKARRTRKPKATPTPTAFATITPAHVKGDPDGVARFVVSLPWPARAPLRRLTLAEAQYTAKNWAALDPDARGGKGPGDD